MKYIGEELDLFSHAKAWKKYYASILKPYLKGDVLEVGGGIGGTTPYLYSRDVKSFTILEPDPGLHAQLDREVLKTYGDQVMTTHCLTVSGLPDTPAYDAIAYIDVLEHIPGDQEELAEAFRRLRPGGYVVVLSPAFEWLRSKFDDAVGHCRRYTAKTLTAVLPMGADPVCVRYLDGVGAMLSLGNRMVLGHSYPTVKQIQFWNRYIIPVSRVTDHFTRGFWGRSVLVIARKS